MAAECIACTSLRERGGALSGPEEEEGASCCGQLTSCSDEEEINYNGVPTTSIEICIFCVCVKTL